MRKAVKVENAPKAADVLIDRQDEGFDTAFIFSIFLDICLESDCVL